MLIICTQGVLKCFFLVYWYFIFCSFFQEIFIYFLYVLFLRCLTKGMNAIVEIQTQRPVPLELYKDYKELGRFMLRYVGSTIAAGVVTEVIIKGCNSVILGCLLWYMCFSLL